MKFQDWLLRYMEYSFQQTSQQVYSSPKHVIEALGYGYYPLPPMLARLVSRIDPAHAHHMVIKARKPAC